MDLDHIVVKPLDRKVLRNFVPMADESLSDLTDTAIHLDHGHRLAEKMVRNLATSPYDGDLLKFTAMAWSNVMSAECGVKVGEPKSNKCRDVKILPAHLLNPVPYWSYERFFFKDNEDAILAKSIATKSYAVHLWNSLSYYLPMAEDGLFAALASANCPLSYSAKWTAYPG